MNGITPERPGSNPYYIQRLPCCIQLRVNSMTSAYIALSSLLQQLEHQQLSHPSINYDLTVRK